MYSNINPNINPIILFFFLLFFPLPFSLVVVLMRKSQESGVEADIWEFEAIFKLVSPPTRRKFGLGSSSKKAFVWVCWWLCLQTAQEQLPSRPKYFGTSCSVPHWKAEEKVILVLKFGFRRVNDQQGSLQFIATCNRCDQQYRWEVLRMERKFQVGEERAGDEDPKHWGSSLKLASLCLWLSLCAYWDQVSNILQVLGRQLLFCDPPCFRPLVCSSAAGKHKGTNYLLLHIQQQTQTAAFSGVFWIDFSRGYSFYMRKKRVSWISRQKLLIKKLTTMVVLLSSSAFCPVYV